ncbi:molybdopterin molybdotransferase MoeA [Agromyces larvae]|uniref:Molybdopterin molybdenumtransferase n=1 Tax=Agromyces larvae TaxID=2929802 RepID=A0ABY4BZD8_9MICO|nr:gephyrin-like molybdotransferase Glp [Agromyces larvae]UOE44274.1 molybdopterin molybdotransferase MoeA [Agromyces larvae]
MITVEAQLARVLAGAAELPHETVPVDAAHGRVLAVDLRSAIDSPRDANSAMDGYALRRADVLGASPDAPVALRVVGEVAAGSGHDPVIAPGEAVRIMTGAPVPADADAVVPIERTADADWAADPVRIADEPAPAAHIRPAGDDLAAGELVLPRGIRLTARALASAVGAGVGELEVVARPRVAIIATGDELAEPGAPLARGQVHDSNSLLVAALAVEQGAVAVHRGRAGDAPGALDAEVRRVLEASVRPDLIVLTGGVSAGAHDPVTRLALEFAKVAMQPGKPQAFGRIDGVPVFGLPGNPVSVAVSFELFVRPFLAVLQGLDPTRPTERAIADEAWRTPVGRRQYQPIVAQRVDGVLHVRPASDRGSGSHLVGRLARAEGFAVVPAEVAAIGVGDEVEVMLG